MNQCSEQIVLNFKQCIATVRSSLGAIFMPFVAPAKMPLHISSWQVLKN